MIRLVKGDITKLEVDAIVNAANETLLGGCGVDGAIHRAAGRDLFKACLAIQEIKPGVRCLTGEAKITPGFNLPAKYIIHTVGPVFINGEQGEDWSLTKCYKNSLALAVENNCKSIAFPCISTGVYGFPQQKAAEIAVREVKYFLNEHPDVDVVFCCFLDEDEEIYNELLNK